MGFLRLLGDLRRRLSHSAAPVLPEAEVERPDLLRELRVEKRVGRLTAENFARELAGFKDHPSPPHLHVVSLSDFRGAVGDKWDRLGSLVDVAVDSIIRRHVDSDRDIFTRLDDEITCLALPHASRSETRSRVAAIAHDISSHLFGDAVIDGRRPQVIAANMPLHEALTAEGDMDRHAISRALARLNEVLGDEGAALPPPNLRPASGSAHRASVGALVTDQDRVLLAEQKRAGGAAASVSGWGKDGDEPDWQVFQAPPVMRGADAERKVMVQAKSWGADQERQSMFETAKQWHTGGQSGPGVAGKSWAEPDGAKGAAASTGSTKKLLGADAERAVMTIENHPSGPGAVLDGVLNPETSLTLVWSPTWVTSRRTIGAFHARVIRTDGLRGPTLEGVEAYNGLTPIEALMLDRFAAAQAAKELKSMFYGRNRMGLTVPVHWLSLAPKWRDCIRIPYEDAPHEARRKLLKVEVFGLNPNIPRHILRNMFEPLERVGCDVMARLPLSALDMIPHLHGPKAFGIDLAELTEEERVGDDQLLVRLQRFRDAARSCKAATYVWGVRRRALIAKLVTSGFSLVNGPGVMCDLSRPHLPKPEKAE